MRSGEVGRAGFLSKRCPPGQLVAPMEAHTAKRGDLVAACPDISPSTIDRALDTLVGDEWIERAGQGRYAVAASARQPV